LTEPIRQFLNMPLPASPAPRLRTEGFCRELTRIGLWRQFKPFIYLNRPARRSKDKGPAFRRGQLHFTTLDSRDP
jgi:hypothetical protein